MADREASKPEEEAERIVDEELVKLIADGEVVSIPKVNPETFDDPQALGCFMMGAHWMFNELSEPFVKMTLEQLWEDDEERAKAYANTLVHNMQVQAYLGWQRTKRIAQGGDPKLDALLKLLETVTDAIKGNKGEGEQGERER